MYAPCWTWCVRSPPELSEGFAKAGYPLINHVGTQLGNYRLVRLLGEGGFAQVYLGEHAYPQTQAAIKVLLGRNGEVLLSDFGIALVVQQAYTAENSLRIAGTIAYMAPEQLRGNALPASDQYGLAALIYEWLCDQLPFQGSFTEVAIQHALVPPTPLHERLPDRAPALEEMVLHAQAKDPR